MTATSFGPQHHYCYCQNLFGYIVLSKNTKLCDKNVTMVQLKLYSNGTRIMNSLVWSHVPLTLMRVLCYHFGQKRNNCIIRINLTHSNISAVRWRSLDILSCIKANRERFFIISRDKGEISYQHEIFSNCYCLFKLSWWWTAERASQKTSRTCSRNHRNPELGHLQSKTRKLDQNVGAKNRHKCRQNRKEISQSKRKMWWR